MRKLIQFFSVLAFVFMPVLVQAQDTVSVKDLNTYPEPLTEFSNEAIQAHPLSGETVVYTGVVVSNPRSSGLATPTDTDNDDIIDDISRIHVFITDTAAVNQGREGMSIQIVESDFGLLSGLNRGDVVTFTGRLTFFNATAQMTVDEAPDFKGSVNLNFPEYAPLLEPWSVSLSEINTANADGTYQINIGNYGKYNGAYVKIENGSVSNVSTGDRPNWAVNADGTRIYTYDTSLRVRNDRTSGYLPSFNYRRQPGIGGEEDGLFVPPVPGAIVNVSGFLTVNGDDPDGTIAANQTVFGINPFEDGVEWQEDINNAGTYIRCVDGEMCNGSAFEWPNDIEVVGLPPVFSNVSQSDSSVTSSDAVTVTVDIVADGAATISAASLIYSAGETSDTLSMTNTSGNTYSATLPTFDNFTPVAFSIEATDSEGLTGRAPISGNYGFFVQDEAINSIAVIQTTADGMAGASPLAGAGAVPVNISGIIVSDDSDGPIILQEAAAAWSGVFLEKTSATEALVRGDSVTITSAEVVEAEVASNSLTLTQLVNLEFTVNSSGNDTEQVIPTITTDLVQELQNGGELEQYEGMLVKFEDVELTDRGAFGEYEFKNLTADSANGVLFNEDIRADATIGVPNVNYDYNNTVREGKTLDAYAIVAASFGAPKFHPRNAADIIAEDGNAFTPVLDFTLTGPADSAEVVVDSDIQVTWNASVDFDEDVVTYEWRLYTADTTTVLATIPPLDNNSTGTSVTIAAATIDALLESAGVAVGEKANFVWNVRVSDGSDTLGVRGPYGDFGDDWEPVYRYLTLERAVISSNEVNGDTPSAFALEQNYPNPFNPSTTIKFALPEAADVTLNVYNMLGQKVNTLINKRMTAGSYDVSFDASNLASGMYIYRIEAGSFSSIKKMMLIK